MESSSNTDLTLADKEWLDIAWKYFQQHAQQRITYLNYFIIFSTILTSGLVATFQNSFNMPSLGIIIGIIQIFLSVVFWKIDIRNKFLTGNAERIIKKIETKYDASGNQSYKLFDDEEGLTKKLKEEEKAKFFLFRQASHGQLYMVLFIFFIVVGGFDIAIASYFTYSQKPSDDPKEIAVTLKSGLDSTNMYRVQLNKIDSQLILNNAKIEKLHSDLDSLRKQLCPDNKR